MCGKVRLFPDLHRARGCSAFAGRSREPPVSWRPHKNKLATRGACSGGTVNESFRFSRGRGVWLTCGWTQESSGTRWEAAACKASMSTCSCRNPCRGNVFTCGPLQLLSNDGYSIISLMEVHPLSGPRRGPMQVAILSHQPPPGDAIGNCVADKAAFFLDRGARVRVYVEQLRPIHPQTAAAGPCRGTDIATMPSLS